MKRIARVVCIAAALLLGGSLPAQEAPPPYIQVSIEDISHDRLAEYTALIKELNSAMQEVGRPSRTVWQVQMGPRARFYTVSPIADLAEYDSQSWLVKAMPDAGERANWLSRIGSITVKREVQLRRTYPELSIPWQDPPSFVVLHLPVNLSGKMPDYLTHLTEKVIPAYKEAGVKGVMVSRLLLGGNGRNWGIARGFEKWTEVQDEIVGVGPVAEALGGGSGVYLASQERYVLALRRDLSFASQ